MAKRWEPAYRPLALAEVSGVAAAGGLLVVHFWAPWNGVDRQYNPALVPVREHFGGRAVFRSADVDEPAYAPLLHQWPVINVPTVAGLVAGACVETVVGLLPAAELATRVGAWVRRARQVIDPRWRTADVLGLASEVAEDRSLDRLPVLADALMDVGCDDERVLGPCRSAGPGGWWVVDLLLAGDALSAQRPR
jgi:thiol-disulfide isomerase/thioredoxin